MESVTPKLGIFISYASADATRCVGLLDLLKQRFTDWGYEVALKNPNTDSLEDSIESLRRADIFVPLISANSDGDSNLDSEISVALARIEDQSIVPIIAENGASIPIFLDYLRRHDFSDNEWDENKIWQLKVDLWLGPQRRLKELEVCYEKILNEREAFALETRKGLKNKRSRSRNRERANISILLSVILKSSDYLIARSQLWSQILSAVNYFALGVITVIMIGADINSFHSIVVLIGALSMLCALLSLNILRVLIAVDIKKKVGKNIRINNTTVKLFSKTKNHDR